MKFTVFRGLLGGLAGVFAALSASPAYASTLNHDLQIGPHRLQLVVWAGSPDSCNLARPRAVQMAEAKKPAASLGAVAPATPAELAAKSLNPAASDPDVPLPHPGLSEEFSDKTDVERPLTGPTPFGRGESGGGVLGLRLPLPTQRAPSGQTTTSGSR
jgi:hypothetical protein